MNSPTRARHTLMRALGAAIALGTAAVASASAPLRATFGPGQDFATGNAPMGVVLADFRGVGKQDVAVVNNVDNTVSVLLGNGNGTFAVKQDFPVCAGPIQVAVGDMNQDGKPDLVVLCSTLYGPGPASAISVLLGNGDGTFQTHVDYGTQPPPPTDGPYTAFAIALGDVNGDGYPDVVAVAPRQGNESASGIEVLMNQGPGGGGALETPMFAGLPSSAVALVLADFNGDHKLDVGYAWNDAGDGLWGTGYSLGNGSGMFNGPVPENLNPNGACGSTCIETYGVATADLNGDGNLDLFFSTDAGPCIMLGDGQGDFTRCTLETQFPNIRGQVVLSDLSNHGTPDVVSAAAVRNTTNWIVKVLIGSGNATFAAGPTLYNQTSNATIGGVAVADVNGNGLPDVVASLTDGNSVRVWLNTSVPDVAPTASNVSVSTLTGNAVNGTLSGAQSQGGFLTYILVTNPSHGSVQLTNAATGAFTYTPTAGYYGSDSFSYEVNDGYLDSNVASVSIAVHSIPTATNNSIATTAGVAVSGMLQGTDPQGNPLTFTIKTNGSKGTATITNASTGAFTYTPSAGQTGQDTFTFVVSNGFATATAQETVIIGAASPAGNGGGGALDLLTLGALALHLLRRARSFARAQA
jgi:hypothetical protein